MARQRRGELTWSSINGRHVLLTPGFGLDDVYRLAVVPSALLSLWPLQPAAGRFDLLDNELVFVPRFPPVPGTSYSLLVDGVKIATASMPARVGAATTRVDAIYPTASEIPLNQLKMYVHFSAPISEGWASRAVHVRRADDGQALPGTFVRMEPELWDRARRRLTLLLDPGRIKRGLAPNAELGYPLEEGVPIVVAVDPSFPDAEGSPLITGAERCYEVGCPVRQHVRPSAWRLCIPGRHSGDQLVVEFDRPLDHAQLEHYLTVLDSSDRPVEGQVSIARDECAWTFTPLDPWRSSVYRISVDARLEDLAGNSITRVFDRDLTRAEDSPIDITRAAVPFHPR